MKNFLSVFSVFAAAVLVFSGCAKQAPKCVSPEDNPAHHYSSGMELIDAGKTDQAMDKFERAIYCDSGYGPAYAGAAIVSAEKAVSAKDDAHRQVDADRAFDLIESAEDNAATPADDFAWRLASMRIYTALKPTRKWLGHVEDDYKKVMKLKVDERRLLYYEGREAASFFMGAAYLEAREFQAARDRFSDVLNEKKAGRWNARADVMWAKADRIVRALAGVTLGDMGKDIAVKDSVTRGDMAALLIDEVKIDRLFAGRIPVKSEIDKLKPEFIPVDIKDSPFREEALTMMKWGIRGLEPVYDEGSKAYLFHPDEPVKRKDFALALEDILIKITGDSKIASAFLGHAKSPFPDVSPTAAWYNAVMNVTTRNIMETDLSGEFRPDAVVDGAEAVLAIRVLKQRLNIY